MKRKVKTILILVISCIVFSSCAIFETKRCPAYSQENIQKIGSKQIKSNVLVLK